MPAHLWWLKPAQWIVTDMMDWLFPLCAINLLWVLLSLTIILCPPATASLFEAGHRAYHGQVPTVSAFLAGVRRWMIPAWKWAGLNLLLIAAVTLLIRTLIQSELLAALIAGGTGLIVFGQLYFWPYVMLQESSSLWQAARNSAFTILSAPLMTGMNLALTVALIIPGIVTIAPVLLFLPVLLSLLYTYSLIAWLSHHHILPDAARDS